MTSAPREDARGPGDPFELGGLGAVWFRHRGSFVLLLVWPILRWALRPRVPSPLELAVGCGLVAAGASLRLTSIRHLGRGARVHSARARGGLTVTGPYARLRNPLYAAAGIVLVGLGLLSGGGWLALALYPATALVYTPTVLCEERAIRAQLGCDYEGYRRLVPRWVPSLRSVPHERVSKTPWSEVLDREPLLVPGLWLATGLLLLIQLGILPVHRWIDAVGDPLPSFLGGLCGLGLLLGAIGHSTRVERKRMRRMRRRRER